MDEFEARLALAPRMDAFDDPARRIGLYLGEWRVVPAETIHAGAAGPVIVADFELGERVAFSTRVQSPEDHSIDQQFREIEINAKDDQFLDTRAQITANIAAGRDPLDDGDEA